MYAWLCPQNLLWQNMKNLQECDHFLWILYLRAQKGKKIVKTIIKRNNLFTMNLSFQSSDLYKNVVMWQVSLNSKKKIYVISLPYSIVSKTKHDIHLVIREEKTWMNKVCYCNVFIIMASFFKKKSIYGTILIRFHFIWYDYWALNSYVSHGNEHRFHTVSTKMSSFQNPVKFHLKIKLWFYLCLVVSFCMCDTLLTKL